MHIANQNIEVISNIKFEENCDLVAIKCCKCFLFDYYDSVFNFFMRIEMVSKKAAGSTEKVSKKTTAKKVSLKSDLNQKPVKSAGAKASTEKVLNTQVPVKADVNPVKDVLEIKAHNAEKKAQKAATKALKEAKVSASEKGAKVIASPKKVAEVKENAQKATLKNFEQVKSERNAEKSVASSKSGLWAAFINGYKKIFNFSGRTSRYEFWAFMLSNLIVASLALPLLLWGAALLVKSGTAILAVLVLALVVEVVVFLSLTVRRLHDAGVSAWKGYFRPVIASFLTLLLMIFGAMGLVSVVGEDALKETLWQCISVFYGLVFIAMMIVFMYYTSKIGIVSSYYEGESTDNLYGSAEFNDDYHKAKGLQYTVLCLTIVSLFYMVLQASRYSPIGY